MFPVLGGFHALRGVIDSVNKLLSVQGGIPAALARKQAVQTSTLVYLSWIIRAVVQLPFISPVGNETNLTKQLEYEYTENIVTEGECLESHVQPWVSLASKSSY